MRETPTPSRRGDILVVDDDADIRELVGAVLEASGHPIQLAEHGARALELARERRPDLILLDLRMPVMDGPGFVRRWSELDPAHEVPIVVMSAYHDARDIARALGADAVLVKPFARAELFRVIERALPWS